MLRCSGAKVRGVILKCVTGLKGTSTPMCNLRLLHVCKVEMDPQLVTFCVVCWLYLVGRDLSGGDIHSETPVFKWSSESQGEKENYDKKEHVPNFQELGFKVGPSFIVRSPIFDYDPRLRFRKA